MRKSLDLYGFIQPLIIILIVTNVFMACNKENLSATDKLFVENAADKQINYGTLEHTRIKGILLDINDVWFLDCNKEYVHVTGKIVYNFNSIRKGNKLHINYQFHYQNVHGIGQSSGAKYTFTGHATEQQNLYYDPANGFIPKTFNITNKLVTTTQGGRNSITTIAYHINRNAAGEVVVDKAKFILNVCN
jgi:hypothetical protein